jgi:hypothetical protein
MSTTVAELHEKARRELDSGEAAFSERARNAAQCLAQAREQGAKQQASADAIGKSRPWVAALLKWHDGGYASAVPFPRATRKSQPADKKKRSSRGATDDLLLREFDPVITQLKKLATKDPGALIRTTYEPGDLERLADFLRNVANAMRATQIKQAA